MKRFIRILVLATMVHAVLVCRAFADLYVVTGGGAGVTAQFNTSGSLVRTLPSAYGTQLAFGPDGDLYTMASRYSAKVTRYNPSTGQSIGVVFSAGSTDYVYGMAFGYDGDLYVSYTMVGGVNTHKMIAHLAGPLSQSPFSIKAPFADSNSAANLTNPNYIAFGPDGDLYSSDPTTKTRSSGGRVLRQPTHL